ACASRSTVAPPSTSTSKAQRGRFAPVPMISKVDKIKGGRSIRIGRPFSLPANGRWLEKDRLQGYFD
ncbi:hypothetical protein, partial [uncultured Brevundimonas sp.]|uniref:hypothetical protein n=1 Tax=uncultured Brevundimonas sp. TaxID=213418 RepID=UPI0025FE9CA9